MIVFSAENSRVSLKTVGLVDTETVNWPMMVLVSIL